MKASQQHQSEVVDVKGYVTVGRAAKYLGISIDTIRRWETAGRLHAVRLDGKNRYFSVSELKQFRAMQPLSTTEVAARLGISESTVRRLEHGGLLTPGRDENNKRTYTERGVQEYLRLKAAGKAASRPSKAISLVEPKNLDGVRLGGPGAVVPKGHTLSAQLQVKEVAKDSISPITAAIASVEREVEKVSEIIDDNSVHDSKGIGSFSLFLLASLVLSVGAISTVWYQLHNNKPAKTPLANAVTIRGENTGSNGGSNTKAQTLVLPQTFFVQLKDTGLSLNITNVNNKWSASVTKGDYASVPVTSAQIEDGGVSFEDLSPEVQNLLANASESVGSGVTNQYTTQVIQGTDVVAGPGLSGTTGSDGLTLGVRLGNTTQLIANNLEVKLGNGSSSTTSSVSGLETTSSGLQLVGGCANGDVLERLSGSWQCQPLASATAGVASLNGLNGALTLNNASGLGTAITIDNAAANGTTKGIATFNASNFTASSGIVNTVQGIGTGAAPTFAGLTLASALSIANGGTGATNAAAARTNLGAAAASTIINCPTVSGSNLTGGGGSFSVGAGGTCSGIGFTASPTFSGLTINGTTTIVGALAATSLSGNGASVTNVDATKLNGQSGTYYLDLGNATGSLDDARLSANVTLQGNATNVANGLVKLNGSSALPTLNGANLTNVDAATFGGNSSSYYLDLLNATGTLAIARIADGSLTNAKLQNNALTITAGAGLVNGGSVALGSSTTVAVGAGNGITVNADDIALNVEANKGLQVSGSGLALIDCGNGQILKYSAGVWGCAADATGGGGGGSNASDITNDSGVVGSTVKDALDTLNGTVDVARGGTGLTSYVAGDLIYASATNNLGSLGIGGSGSCLLSDGSAPYWGTCASGSSGISDITGTTAGSSAITGSLTFNNALTTGGAITIDNAKADSSTKGIATFASANFQDNGSGLVSIKSGGVGATEIVDGSIKATELNTTNAANNGYVLTYDSVSGGFTWTDPASFDTDTTYVAGSGLTLSGTTFNIGAGSCITANADDIAVTDGCVNAATLGGFSSSAFALAGSGVTSLNTLSGGLSVVGGSQIAITDNGSDTITLAVQADSIGDAQLQYNTGQNLTTASSPSFAGLTLSNLTDGIVTTTSGVLSGGTLSRNSGALTGVLSIANGGTGAGDAATALANLGGIAGLNGTADQIIVTNNGDGTFTLSAPQNLGTSSSVSFGTINGATISGGTLSAGSFSGGSVSGGSLTSSTVNGLNVSSGTINGATLSGTFTGSGNPTFSGIGTINGLTLANTSVSAGGALTIASGGSGNLTLNAAGNIVLSANGSLLNCGVSSGKLTTNASGVLQCATDQLGGGGGVVISGTADRLALFNATGDNVVDADLQQIGGTLQLDTLDFNIDSGDLQVGGTTVLTNSGVLQNLTGLNVASGGASISGNSSIAGTLTGLTGLTAGGTITFSGLSNGVVHATGGVLSGGPVVLGTDTSGSYVSSVNGQSNALTISNASGSAGTITIDDAAADGTTKGIAAFNGANFTATSGVINTIQGISSSDTPTFNGLTLTTALSVTSGGTGATNASNARSNLGAAARGANSDITSLSGLTTALSVSQGGTGAASFANTNGLVYYDGTKLANIVAGATNQCLLGNTGAAPSWGTCPGANGVSGLNGQNGAVSISNASANSGVITIDDAVADGATKGIAAFDSTNFQDDGSGVINTIQDIDTTADVDFNSLKTGGTSRINASGNLINIGTITTSGAINGATVASGSFNGVNIGSGTVNGLTISSGTLGGVTGITFASGNLALGNGDLTTTGAITAGSFTGDGSGLTSVNATSLAGQNGAYYLNLGNATGTLDNTKLDHNAITINTSGNLSGGNTVALNGTLNLSFSDNPTFASGLTVSAGGASITGNSTIAGTLSGLTGLTVASGGANITGGVVADTFSGDGSSLTNIDAATLGSHAASYFTDASNISNGTLATGRGGTGITSYTSGDLLYASGTNTLNKIAISGTTGQCLVSDGVTPQWGSCLGGGAVSTTGSPTSGTIAIFTGAGTISNSALSQSGAVLSLATGNNLNLVSGSLQIAGSTVISSGKALQNLTGITLASGNLDLNGGNVTNGGTISATSFSGSLTGNVTGNVSGTASSLAANPTDCGSNTFAQSIDASGNLSCAHVALGSADVTGNLRATNLQNTPTDLGAADVTVNISNSNSGGYQTNLVTDGTINGATIAATSFNGVTVGSGAVNGLAISGGSLSSVTGITFASGNLNLNGGNLTNGGTITATSFNGALTGNVTGNAATATQFAANPSDCAANTFATTIAQNGDLTCVAIAANNLPSTAADLGNADVTVDLSNSHAGRNTNLTIDGTINGSTVSATSFNGVTIGSGAVNGVAIAGGALSSVTGITFASGNLALGGGNITGVGTISAATTATINGINVNAGAVSGVSTLNLSGSITGATSNTINGLSINSGALSGVTSISASGSITAATSNTINGININSGAVSGVTSLGLTGAISGGTSYSGSGNITTSAGNINATAGAIQTAGTNRIDNSGNLVNIGNLTGTGAVTITSTGGASDLSLNSGSGTINLGATKVVTTAGLTYDLVNGSDDTFAITNSGAGKANLTVEGTINTATISGGSVSGGSLTSSTVNGLNVSSGTINGATLSGTFTGSGAPTFTGIGTINGLTLSGTKLSAAGALEVASAGSGDLTLTAASGKAVLGASTVQTSNSVTLDLNSASADTSLSIVNNGAGHSASLSVEAGASFGGAVTISSGGANITGGLTAGGTITLGGLNTSGVVHTNGSGTLSTGDVALGSETAGNYLASLGSLTGLTLGGTNATEGGIPTLAVNYGSSANQAAAGSNTFTCNSGTGNLSGGGGTVTLGTSGTSCGAISITNAPTFTTSVTTPTLTSGGALTVSSTGSNNLTLTSGSGTVTLNAGTIQRTAGLSFDLTSASATTFAVTNSGAGVAGLTVEGGGSFGGNVAVTSGGLTITGNSTISGTLSGLTGLTVASGGLNVTGNSTISGSLSGVAGLTIASGGITNSGGFNNANGGITNAGAVSGVSTLTTSGAINGQTISSSANFTGSVTVSSGVTAANLHANNGTDVTCTGTNYLKAIVVVDGIMTGQDGCAGIGLSDERLKKDIVSLDGTALDKIKDVNAVNFNFDCSSSYFEESNTYCDTNAQTGVIAQELAAIFPDLVSTDEYGYYHVDYQGLGVYNLKAVSQLAQFIDSSGNADFKDLSADSLSLSDSLVLGDGLSVDGLAEFNGHSVFDGTVSFGNAVTFNGSVTFNGQTHFNSNTGGYATINAGEDVVHVSFASAYAAPPVISATLGNGVFAQYSTNNVTATGFDIVLSQPATTNLDFSWIALSITNPTSSH